jgi:hypothetical protein
MFMAKDSGGGTDWEPLPAGVYHSIAYAVVDLGTQHSQMFDSTSHKCWIAWEIPELRIDVEIDGEKVDKPRIISEFYTVSLHEKANLRIMLESWRGLAFTPEQLAGFDISKLFGVNGQINVIHKKKKDGKTKSVIGSIMPLAKVTPKKETENDYVYFSFEEHGLEVPESVPEGIKNMIMKSREWNETDQHPLQDSDPWGNNQPPQEPDMPIEDGRPDSIPF